MKLTADLPVCVSGRIKSQDLDKSKDLGADTGHHSGTDCTPLECGSLFFPVRSPTLSQARRPALHQTSLGIDLKPAWRRGETEAVDGWGWSRALTCFPTSLRHSESEAATARQRFWGLIAVFFPSMLSCSNIARGSPRGLQTVWDAATCSQEREASSLPNNTSKLNANFSTEMISRA